MTDSDWVHEKEGHRSHPHLPLPYFHAHYLTWKHWSENTRTAKRSLSVHCPVSRNRMEMKLSISTSLCTLVLTFEFITVTAATGWDWRCYTLTAESSWFRHIHPSPFLNYSCTGVTCKLPSICLQLKPLPELSVHLAEEAALQAESYAQKIGRAFILLASC